MQDPLMAADEHERAQAVREMFTAIAPRYDLVNHVLSFSIDKHWWRRTAQAFAHILRRDEAAVLDLCCGTGDMTFALARTANGRRCQLTGIDFSHSMLARARAKSAHWQFPQIAARWIEADALRLPFRDHSFQLVTSAFGFRNLANYAAGLQEIYRVLAPGGEMGILDFGKPGGIAGKIYQIYFRHLLPRIGTLVSGVRGPYSYLPASVQSFPETEAMLALMRATGFEDAGWTPYLLGIVGLYRGRK